MITALDCYKKYGMPENKKNMAFHKFPEELHLPAMPRRIYCNLDLILPLEAAIRGLYENCVDNEVSSFDGIFNIRVVRGYEEKYKQLIAAGQFESAVKYLSLHSWGIAIDLNAASNPLGGASHLSQTFVDCFIKAGFDWGGNFKNRKDPMHFQLAKI